MPDAAPSAFVQPGPEADLPADFRIAPQGADGRVVIDLMPIHPYRRCPVPVAGEITVCAEDPDRYRYRRELDVPPPDGEGKAQFELVDGVEMQVETEQVNIGGFPSNRVMDRATIKF